jgi:D-alanyl-D-alanine carboxypeptidase
MTQMMKSPSWIALMIWLILQIGICVGLMSCSTVQPTTAPATPPEVVTTGTRPVDDRTTRVATRIQQILASLQARTGFPGAGVAFILPDGARGAVAVGLADVERDIPMRIDHRLPAGSIGKTFVAAVALQMVEVGQLALDQPISKWLGDRAWFDRLPNHDSVTLRNLMNHTSGIPEHVQMPEFRAALRDNPDKVWTPDELIAFVLDRPALFAAGAPGDWAYADTNYILLGMIIEQVSGKSVYELVATRLLKPLHLIGTLPQDRRDLPGLACGYMQPGKALIEVDPSESRTLNDDGRFFINPQFEWCGGGFISAPRDLATWCHALYATDNVLKQNTREMMFDSVPATTGREQRYGLGVQIRPTSHGMTFGHGGWFPGAMSEMLWYAEHDITLAIMVNSDHHTTPRLLIRCLDECADAMLQELGK